MRPFWVVWLLASVAVAVLAGLQLDTNDTAINGLIGGILGIAVGAAGAAVERG